MKHCEMQQSHGAASVAVFGYSCFQKFLVSRAVLPQYRDTISAALPRVLHHIQMISYYKINMSLNSIPIYLENQSFLSSGPQLSKVPRFLGNHCP